MKMKNQTNNRVKKTKKMKNKMKYNKKLFKIKNNIKQKIIIMKNKKLIMN